MKMLPSYIVNCFMPTGYDSYDTLDVLADINDESLAEIEDVVTNEYPNETCFRYQPIPTYLPSPSSNVFKFQPGHCKRIRKFVDEVKQLVSICAKERQLQSTRTKRRSTIEPGVKRIKRPNTIRGLDSQTGLADCTRKFLTGRLRISHVICDTTMFAYILRWRRMKLT